MNFTPIKPIKLPNRLIYTAGKEHHIFSTKNGDVLGCIKFNSIRDFGNKFGEDMNNKSLYINDLFVCKRHRRKGVGSNLIKFAQNISMRNGANGNLHLVAYNIEHPGQPPHKFYRKLNFTTGSKEYDAIIDDAIKNNEPIPAMFTQGTDMFYRNI